MGMNLACFSKRSIQTPWLLVLLLISFVSTSVASPILKKNIPRLSVRHGLINNRSNNTAITKPSNSNDLQTFFYDQTLDHFNYQPESYITFKQRYVVNSKHWGGAHVAAPIFVYLGEESDLDDDIDAIGFLPENAARFNALQVYIEHRFYGKSVPFGSVEKAMRDPSVRGHFSSAQALADYAEVILHLKQRLSADASPVIAVGGSYGGMLAAWFRLKYPHIALGALASSAPILYFDNITPSDGYYSVVTKDFRKASHSCYRTIKRSWDIINKVAAKPNGLSYLSTKFKTCKPLQDVSELTDYLDSMYCVAAQYDRPPKYPVNKVCNGINGASQGKDILSRIFSGIVAFRGNHSCYNFSQFFSSETLDGWSWQTCSELVIPIGRSADDTMFPAQPFVLSDYIDECKNAYGVVPRPHWITTYYGGHHIKEVLKRFGSNIIFSNGLRDPYSSGGVLENISESIVAVHTKAGSHCLDILPGREDDPKWLGIQRNVELDIIQNWISKYYQQLIRSSPSKLQN